MRGTNLGSVSCFLAVFLLFSVSNAKVVDSFSKCTGAFYSGGFLRSGNFVPSFHKSMTFLCEELVVAFSEVVVLKKLSQDEKLLFAIAFCPALNVPLVVAGEIKYRQPAGFVRGTFKEVQRFHANEELGGVLEENPKHDWYTNSGFQRGHLFPAGLFNFDFRAYYMTFQTANIAPQKEKQNTGPWLNFEYLVRSILLANPDKKYYLMVGTDFKGTVKTFHKLGIPNAFYAVFLSPSDNNGFGVYVANTDKVEKLTILTVEDVKARVEDKSDYIAALLLPGRFPADADVSTYQEMADKLLHVDPYGVAASTQSDECAADCSGILKAWRAGNKGAGYCSTTGGYFSARRKSCMLLKQLIKDTFVQNKDNGHGLKEVLAAKQSWKIDGKKIGDDKLCELGADGSETICSLWVKRPLFKK